MPRLLLFAALALAAGCGGDTVRVTGRLVKDGQPYTPNMAGDQPDTLALDLVGGGMVFPATVGPDGRFSFPGPAGSGVPRGTYKLSLLHSGYMGAGGDRLKGRFAADKSPLTVDLSKPADLTVDVGAGTVTTN